MHRSTDKDQRATHAFVDITTGQFVFRGQPRTTAKVQVVAKQNYMELNDSIESTQIGKNWDTYNSPSDDSP